MTHPRTPSPATEVPQPDGQLAQLLSAEAFAARVAIHPPRVLRFAAAFHGDRHLPDDVVQEALGRLVGHRSR